MTKEQEALKLALEALENLEHSNFKRRRLDALLAIKEVLAQTIAEEHFAKFDSDIDLAVNKAMVEEDDDAQDYVRPWVGLTFEERNGIWRKEIGWGDPSHNDEDLMKAIEAKLKEKNNG
jgi:hypothetical protein